MIVLRHDHEATMLVTPADHLIEPPACFHSAVLQANRIIEADPRKIVTFGIRPSYPAETFGYIERGEALGKDDAAGEAPAYRVHMFREKPSALVAQQYVDSGRFYWNSGIFVWKAQTILDALQEYEPEMYAQLETLARAMGTPAFEASLEKEFAAIRGKSIDYAVMERYPNVAVVEALFAWDDVGSWRSLNRIRGADADGNTVDGKHLGLRTHGCIVRGERDHLIVTVGLEDCIIVHTPTATLVARKQDEESVRQVVEMIRQHGWSEYL
jgi:mannose-1-phosphate guanylyltransferase